MDRTMSADIEERTMIIGHYIVEQKATVRAAAKYFGVSKSTVHKDVSERLRGIDPQLYVQAKAVLDQNKAQRHIRGGMATKEKYRLEHFARENARKHLEQKE